MLTGAVSATVKLLALVFLRSIEADMSNRHPMPSRPSILRTMVILVIAVSAMSATESQPLVVDRPLTNSRRIPGFLHLESAGSAIECDASAIIGIRMAAGAAGDTTLGFDERMESLGFRSVIVPVAVMPSQAVLALVGSLKRSGGSLANLAYGQFTGLVGAEFRYGDIMDGIRPIYAREGLESAGIHRGGSGGITNELKKPGYAVVGLTVFSGMWNDVRCVCAIQFQWARIAGNTIEKSTPILDSELIGSTSAVGNVMTESVKADEGGFVKELKIETVSASNGVTSVGKLVVVTVDAQGRSKETSVGAKQGTKPITPDVNF